MKCNYTLQASSAEEIDLELYDHDWDFRLPNVILDKSTNCVITLQLCLEVQAQLPFPFFCFYLSIYYFNLIFFFDLIREYVQVLQALDHSLSFFCEEILQMQGQIFSHFKSFIISLFHII